MSRQKLIPRVVYDVARELIREFGKFDEGKVYVDADHVHDAVDNHEDATDEWFDWLNLVINEARFEITWSDAFVNGYHESCPYDCSGCHDDGDEHCTCDNCERCDPHEDQEYADE